MSKGKPGYLMKDGEFVLHDGKYVDICDYGNCRQPVKGLHMGNGGYIYCEKHLAEEVWKYTNCPNCHKRTMPKERGINICKTPGCHAANWIL